MKTEYEELDEYLINNSKFGPGSCWLWTGHKIIGGYGGVGCSRWRKQYKIYSAHRLSYHHYKGPIPDKMHVLHKCDNPICINPDHLWIGTHKDNMNDMKAKGRAGQKKGAKNGAAKLSKRAAQYIYDSNGIIHHLILAKQFNVCRQTIRNIQTNITHYLD